jgi:predicted Zn-ribbon and HTH transcriptional regulator
MSINLYDWCCVNNKKLIVEWDKDKNIKSMSDYTYKSGLYAYWVCSVCGHSWHTKICNRSNGSGCPNCANKLSGSRTIQRQLAKNGSLKDSGLDCVYDWDYNKNIIDPSEVAKSSNKIVWWKCKDCGHEWQTSPNARSKGHRCPRCVENQDMSSIQKKTQDYLLSNYEYELKHEKCCSIVPKNPKTNYDLPYDNEVIISTNAKLIIEVNGEQHYKITEFIKMDAKKHNVTPEEELRYLQWKDEYKQQYALSNGYYYLALPYWTFDDNSYTKLIDNKIQEILNNTKLTCVV